MPVRVTIYPADGQYRAVCSQLGLEVFAPTKEEASEKINSMIVEKVGEVTAGNIPKSSGAPPVCSSTTKRGGCHGCGG